MQRAKAHWTRDFFSSTLCAMALTVSPATKVMAAPPKGEAPITVNCQNISYRSCLDKIAEAGKITILAPSQLDAKEMTVILEKTTVLDAVRQATQDTGERNYAFSHDTLHNALTVLVPGLSAVSATPSAPSDVAAPPSKDLTDMPDTKQLDMMQARSELDANLDTPLGLDLPDGQTITLRQIMQIVESQPPVPQVIVPPDIQISVEELEKILKANMEQSRDLNRLPDEGEPGASGVTFDEFKKKYDAELKAYMALSQKTPEETVMGYSEEKK